MEILRVKTLDLRQTRPLSALQNGNSRRNMEEAEHGATILKTAPRRLVFEMTNACNLNCRMCGRNAAHFKPTVFKPEWREFFAPVLDKVEEITLMGWGEPTVHPQFADFLYWGQKYGLRKYFCTNGMKLAELQKDIFEAQVDIIAISMDGGKAETNDYIRRGADFNKILTNLRGIVAEKQRAKLAFPYMNFVFTAMRSNIGEFPQLVKIAGDIGLEEVKLVYFTVFDKAMLNESLYNEQQLVQEVFEEAIEVAKQNGVALKLPHLQGQDPAGDAAHKTCFAAWRDFFLGSDGFIRPCMSTSAKFAHIDELQRFDKAWNAPFYQEFRAGVNAACPATAAALPEQTPSLEFGSTAVTGSATGFSSNSGTNNASIKTSEAGQLVLKNCANCYQSSFTNWNRKEAFDQTGNAFAPEWG